MTIAKCLIAFTTFVVPVRAQAHNIVVGCSSNGWRQISVSALVAQQKRSKRESISGIKKSPFGATVTNSLVVSLRAAVVA